jgi:DNA-binding CsgD family transcriptional regulator
MRVKFASARWHPRARPDSQLPARWLLVVADTASQPGIRGLFDGLVPGEVIDAYEHLLATAGCAKSEAESAIGTGMVDELTRRGMVHIQPHSPVDPAWLRPASPDIALQGVLVGHQSQLARGQELLLDGHRRLATAQASSSLTGRFPEHLVSVVSGWAEISELSASLMNSARQDWVTLENLQTEMPLTEDFAEPPLPAFEGRVRCRSIYAAAAMEDPVARRIIWACAEAGEQVRLLPKVPMKMKLADFTAAMLPLTPTGTGGALVIKAPVILVALREYFDLLWDRATPLLARPASRKDGADLPTPAQQKILALMAEGLQDAAIARRAGVSLTTVRRTITAIQNRLGVSSRFAAGAAAQRRGWIG